MGESARIPTIDHILEQIVARAATVIPFDSGGIARFDAATGMLIPCVYFADGEPANAKLPSVAMSEGIIGRVARTRQPAFVPDVHDDPDYIEAHSETRAEIAAPMVVEGRLLGVFNAESHAVDAFTPDHLRTLAVLADQAAIAMVNALLLEQASARLNETEVFQRIATLAASTLDLDKLLARIAAETAALMGVRDAAIFLPGPSGQTLRLHRESAVGVKPAGEAHTWSLDGSSAMARVFSSGEAFLTNDAASADLPHDIGLEKVVLVPMAAHNQTLGVLAVANPTQGDFEQTHIKTLRAIADQVAIAMQNANLLAAERRRADMMALTNQIGQQITVRLELSSLMRAIVDGIHDTLGYEAVYLLTLENDVLVLQACAVDDVGALIEQGFSFAAGRGVSGRALRTRTTQLVPDVAKDPDYFSPESMQAYRSCMTIPLKLGDDALGVLDILSTRYNAFDTSERHVLETLASQVAIAIDNATRYAREQTRRRRAERLQETAQLINRQLQVHALVEAVSSEAAAIFDVPVTSIKTSFHAESRTPYGFAAHGISLDVMRRCLANLPGVEASISTGDVVHYPDLRDIVVAQESIEQASLRAMLAVPFMRGPEYMGYLGLYTRNARRAFDADDIDLARLLANQVSIALDNARLFATLELHAQELAKSNRLKSEFLANISHELRTPMNAIIGFSEALLSDIYGPLADRQRDRLDSVLRNARNLLALIEDLLDISKIAAGRLQITYEVVALRHEIEGAVAACRADAEIKGLDLRAAFPDSLPSVRGDTVRVRQVLNNLISNAVKFTPDGYIEISAAVYQRDGRSWVRCSVEDTGIGIAPKDQQIIFDEFRQVDGSTTRMYGGTGLGLAITKKLVEMMGGRLWVESEGVGGKGSTFVFELPVALETDVRRTGGAQ